MPMRCAMSHVSSAAQAEPPAPPVDAPPPAPAPPAPPVPPAPPADGPAPPPCQGGFSAYVFTSIGLPPSTSASHAALPETRAMPTASDSNPRFMQPGYL